VTLWFGCEQKGDISPTGASRHVLTFIDTVVVDPQLVGPGEIASIGARILNETNEPAENENVRISVNRGMLGSGKADTTVLSDRQGWARATFTAPSDTGPVLVRTELSSMSETRTSAIQVSSNQSAEGMLTVWADRDTLFADNGVSQTVIYARLRNEAHNPIAGATIFFSTDRGSITSPAVTDSVSGTARATLVSTTENGPATISATRGTTTATTTVVFVQPTSASLIVVSATRPQLTAGSDSTVVTARIYDSQNLPVADNTLVFFSATRGNLRNLTARVSGGVASTIYYAASTTGDVTLRATTGGTIYGTTLVSIRPGATARMTVTSSEDTLFADNSSEATITVLVSDAYGNPVLEGTPVAFSADGGTINESATVGQDGRAIGNFRAGLSVGPAAINVSQGGIQRSIAIYLEPTIAASINLLVTPLQLVANGTAQASLRATVLDAENRPVSDGTPVTFIANHGGISGAAAAVVSKAGGVTAKNSTPWNAVIDRSAKTLSKRPSKDPFAHRNPSSIMSMFTATTTAGYAQATLTSPTLAGLDSVVATVQTLADLQTVSYQAGPAALIQVTPGQSQLPADGISTTPVTCRVTDAFGNALSSGLAIQVTSTLGNTQPASGYTNSDGVFTTNLITSHERGLCALVARVEGAAGYGEVTFSVPAVTSVSLTSAVTSIRADGIASTDLAAMALDAYNLPVEGVTVTWQADAGVGHLVATSTVTDTLGRAFATFYSGASQTDVSQNVRAVIGSHSDSRAIRMLGISVSAWTDDAELPADGQSTTNANVLVRETTSGFALTNATVRFAATSGSIIQIATTDASGIARALYRSGTQSGDVQITAIYGDTLRALASLRLTNTAADTVIATLGQNELVADGISSTIVSAVVYNEGGQPVPNTPVSFSVVGPGSFLQPVVMTDSTGHAIATYRSAALTEDAGVDLQVAIERTGDQKPMMLRGLMLNVRSVETSLPANGLSTTQIQVELRQSSSLVAVPNASIQMGSSLGTIPAVAVTGTSGIATVNFTAGSETGLADIIARYGDLLTDTAQINLFAPAAFALDLSSSAASLLGNGLSSSLLEVTVLDQRGTPLRNALINWTAVGGGTLASLTSMTDGNGTASNLFTSPATASDVQTRIIATAANVSDTVFVQSRGVTLTLSAVTSTIPANGSATTQILAHLRETSSMVAISNAEVNFGTSSGSITGTTLSDSAGTAQVTLTSSNTAGIATVVCRYGNLLADTVNVTFYAAAPSRIVAFADTSLLRADGVSSTPVHAYVYDAQNIPLAGATVTWNAAVGSMSVVQTVTNSAGIATVIYQTSASTADRGVSITATSGTAQGIASVLERGITVQVTATPDNVVADGSSTSLIRAHIFETTTSVGISDVSVSFGTTLGTIPSNALTDQSGVATATLVSSTQTGVATVQARYGNLLTAQATVAFSPSTPTTLSLTGTPTVLFADNNSTSTLTAVVTDQNGNPVPNGTQVRFSIPPQGGSLENLRTTRNGVAVNTLTSSANQDTVRIVAWADANPSARDSVTVIYIVGPAAVVTLSAQQDTLDANGIAVDTITAHVTDAVGHILSNVEVLFTTTIGNITASRVTDASGNAHVAFSSSQTGTAQISATAGSANGVYTLHLVSGVPNSISMEYFPGSVGVRGSGRNETLLITATVRDANNNPVVDGTPVMFNINNSPGGGDFLSSNGPIPTINGRATVSYNSGTVSGSVRIRALCSDVSAVSTEILIYSGPPYMEDVNQGCSTSHMSLAASPCSMFGMDVVGDSVTLIALIGDRYNNPVTPGTAVYFSTSGGVITTGTGYTDSSGFARVTLYSGSPLPTVSRWLNTLRDPNTGAAIQCTSTPPQPGIAKVLATSAGVDSRGDSVTVWAATNVLFDYSHPNLFLRSTSVNGDPNERTLYIGQSAAIRIAVYDADYWPMPAGSVLNFSANHGMVYPSQITIGCPGDTSYTVSFFNNLGITDDDAASPVLITVDTRQGDAYVFTESFTLRASLPN
jgi:adhesin/invasin